jgi:23S rRNA pseudouridine1911/1915/1917 synthase
MQLSPFPILFEDADILVIDKPAGIVVNASDSVREETVQSWMQRYLQDTLPADNWYQMIPEEFTQEYGSPQDIFTERTGVVHRLDRDTSGALVLAKNPGALVALMYQFKMRETRKEYACLVHGELPIVQDTIRMPIMRSMSNRSKFAVATNGKPAETEYKVIGVYQLPPEQLLEILRRNEFEKGRTDAQITKEYQSYGRFSLLTCYPKTGRTHQIRVHFAFLQHPLVGDQTYTNKWRGKADQLWCGRQFLHASSIQFQHPRTKEVLTIAAPLEQDLATALTQLTQV